MRKHTYLLLFLLILELTIPVQTIYAQGGDGVDGAGNSGDSGVSMDQPTSNDNNGGEAQQGEQQGQQGEQGQASQGTENDGQGVDGSTNDGASFGNQSSWTQDAFMDAAGGDRSLAEQMWNAEHNYEVSTGETRDGRDIGEDGKPVGPDPSQGGSSSGESRGESLSPEAAQGAVNSASADQKAAYEARQNAETALAEARHNGTFDEIEAAKAAFEAADGRYQAASHNLSVAVGNAEAAGAQAQQSQSQAQAAAQEQQSRQDAATAAGTQAIDGGNKDLDSVISGISGQLAGLSPDRSAAVIGALANQLGIDPGQAAAYASHYAVTQPGATTSSVAGSAAIAATSAGGSPEQVAASAAAAAAMQVAQAGGTTDAQSQAAKDAGLASFTTAVNSSSMSADDKAQSITNFGIQNGNTVASIAAAVSTTGVDQKTGVAGIVGAYEARDPGSGQYIASLANSGWQTAPASGATATGAPTATANITPGGNTGSPGGNTPTTTEGLKDAVAAANANNGLSPQERAAQVIEAGLEQRANSRELGVALRDIQGIGSDLKGLQAQINSIAEQKGISVPSNYASQVTGFRSANNPGGPGGVGPITAPAAASSTTTNPASNPASAPAAPAQTGQAAFDIPAGQYSVDLSRTVPVSIPQEAGAVSITGTGSWGRDGGGGISWSMSGYQGSGSVSRGENAPETGTLTVTTTQANGSSSSKNFDIAGVSFSSLQTNFSSIETPQQLNNAINNTPGIKAK